ncbi:MAG TPA: hypothetical protein P5042_02780, partial [Candidatus Izemoplasmatales bacterium]|nr:hypothetical protein [Candidatus Izemoplasmatales bacterium]
MKNNELEKWLEEITAWCSPDKVVLWHGTKDEYDRLAQSMVDDKKAIRLNEKLRPNCLLFRTDPSDVARVEQRTFISSVEEKDAGPTNNWIDPKILKPTMWEKYHNSMKGRTMYVIPFSMGPVGSKFSKLGVELTDSAYVTLNMHIMTRTGDKIMEMIDKGTEFVKCLHSIGYPLNE